MKTMQHATLLDIPRDRITNTYGQTPLGLKKMS